MVRKIPKKICNFSGCNEIISYTEKYCSNHVKEKAQSRSDHNRRYDEKIRNNRDKKYNHFYHSKEWMIARQYVLALYKGLDMFAYYIENEIVYASTAHHIVEIKDDWSKRLDIDNLFPVNESNHNKIHALYKNNKTGTQKLLKDLLIRYKKEFGR